MPSITYMIRHYVARRAKVIEDHPHNADEREAACSACVCDSWPVDLDFAGAVPDLSVSDLGRAEAFYTLLIGRGPDLRPQPEQREWRLHRDPEVALRITADQASAGHGRLDLGVPDLAAERSRLLRAWADLPEAVEKPGVICCSVCMTRTPTR